MTSRRILAAFCFTAILLFMASCGVHTSPWQETANPDLDGAPMWVIKGCPKLYESNGHPALCAVGSCGKVKTRTLGSAQAIAQARNELAKPLQDLIRSVLKDYRSTTDGAKEFGADDRHFEEMAGQILKKVQSATPVTDTWISPSGMFYALVVTDVDYFRDAVNSMQNLSEAARAGLKGRAGKAFDSLHP